MHSFRTLLATLGSVTRNLVRLPAHPEIAPFHVVTTPDQLQQELLRLVGAEVTAERRQNGEAGEDTLSLPPNGFRELQARNFGLAVGVVDPLICVGRLVGRRLS